MTGSRLGDRRMAKPPEMTDEEYYAIRSTWLLPLGVSVRVPKARKQMCNKLDELGRRRSGIYFTILDELQREGIGSSLACYERGKAICKAVDDRIEAWSDAQLDINPPVPQTPIEELLQEHHRLQWAE
jgi:hypothetical protein